MVYIDKITDISVNTVRVNKNPALQRNVQAN